MQNKLDKWLGGVVLVIAGAGTENLLHYVCAEDFTESPCRLKSMLLNRRKITSCIYDKLRYWSLFYCYRFNKLVV